jgi:hypothetical protein
MGGFGGVTMKVCGGESSRSRKKEEMKLLQDRVEKQREGIPLGG